MAFGLLVTRKFIHGPCGLGLTCLCDIQASATLVLPFRRHDEVGSLEFFLRTMPNHTHSALFVICMSGEIFTFLFSCHSHYSYQGMWQTTVSFTKLMTLTRHNSRSFILAWVHMVWRWFVPWSRLIPFIV